MKGLSSKKKNFFLIERKGKVREAEEGILGREEGVLEMKPNCKNYLTNSLIFYILKSATTRLI